MQSWCFISAYNGMIACLYRNRHKANVHLFNGDWLSIDGSRPSCFIGYTEKYQVVGFCRNGGSETIGIIGKRVTAGSSTGSTIFQVMFLGAGGMVAVHTLHIAAILFHLPVVEYDGVHQQTGTFVVCTDFPV